MNEADSVNSMNSMKEIKKTILSRKGNSKTSPVGISNDNSTKRKKSVSFSEKKNFETKKYSIEEEIKRRSLDAQRKSINSVPTKGLPKKTGKESAPEEKKEIGKDDPKNMPTEASKEIKKDMLKGTDLQDDKNSEKTAKNKKRRHSLDIKNKISPDGVEPNESDMNTKKSNDAKEKNPMNAISAKKLKGQVEENDEPLSETPPKKGRRRSLGKGKKGKKGSEDTISDEQKSKNSSDKDGNGLSNNHSSKDKDQNEDVDHQVEHEDEEHHHHHHHHHGHQDHHHHHDDDDNDHHHDSDEEHQHHHHHHHRKKKDKLNIHLHAHRTREQRTWVTEMRGYSSEPVLPLPFEKKFTKIKTKVELKPYMKKLHKKYLSMDDIFLSHDGYPKLIIDDKEDPSIKTYAVRAEMLKSWDELFEMERQRYSFFDELFARGYVLDSLEIPRENDRTSLFAAEDDDLRANLEFGRAVFKTKNIYTGEFKDKHFDGVGRYQWIDGTVFQGHFHKGIMHGHGKIQWKDGSLYEGEFVEGTRAGWGIYSTMQGYTYLGSWENGLPHGPGKMWYDIRTDNTDYYDGHWTNGIQDGLGTRQYGNGDRYIGQFSGGVRNGKGTMIWLKERQVYKGHWVNGVPHGFGTHIWYLTRTNTSSFPTRHIYRGQWVDGKRDGIGKMIYPCGSVYEGRWKDGQRFAKGLFVNPAGELLVGLFRAGSVCGGTEIPLHAPPYECDYTALVDWINRKFHLEDVENLDQKLHKVVSKHLELFRKLYKRAGQLGQSWGNNGLFPSWLKRGKYIDEHGEIQIESANNVEDAPHMLGKEKKPHNPDNVYPVFRFGMWLLIKDISGLLDTVTMAHYDIFWSECPSLSFQTLHNPFEPVYLWQFLQCLIIIAVSYYVDGPNRKYKLRLVSEERKKRKIEAEVRQIEENLKKVKSPSPPPLEPQEETLDPCAQWIRDHQRRHEEDEEDSFQDDEEEDEEQFTIQDDIKSTESDLEEVESEQQLDTDDTETAEQRRLSLKEKYSMYYKKEEGGEGYLDFGLKSQFDLKGEVDDDDYSTFSYSTDGRESPPSVESRDDVIEDLPLTILSAFELLINEKLLKVVKRPPGKHLPRVPDPLPSMSDLYYSFKSVNNTDVITGTEFLISTVPHGVFPNPDDAIFWHRSKELLSGKLDLDSLFQNFQSSIVETPVVEEETLGEEFLGSTINTAESFTAKLKNEAEPEFERSHRTTVEILKTDRKNWVFNQPAEGDENENSGENAKQAEEKFRREKYTLVRDPDEMFAESNPFDDADLAKEPFLYTQTRTCDRIQKKPFNPRWLGAHDVTRVFRRVYPKLADAHHKSNIPSKMVFCDWLWCISLCSRISADREFLSVINDHTRMRPRLFHTAPHIGIHSPTEVSEKWKHHSVRLGNSLYYMGEKKELVHVK